MAFVSTSWAQQAGTTSQTGHYTQKVVLLELISEYSDECYGCKVRYKPNQTILANGRQLGRFCFQRVDFPRLACSFRGSTFAFHSNSLMCALCRSISTALLGQVHPETTSEVFDLSGFLLLRMIFSRMTEVYNKSLSRRCDAKVSKLDITVEDVRLVD
jgi:hypothetical protein